MRLQILVCFLYTVHIGILKQRYNIPPNALHLSVPLSKKLLHKILAISRLQIHAPPKEKLD